MGRAERRVWRCAAVASVCWFAAGVLVLALTVPDALDDTVRAIGTAAWIVGAGVWAFVLVMIPLQASVLVGHLRHGASRRRLALPPGPGPDERDDVSRRAA